jgi:SagB-type dehydrogenase family enzyme
VELLVKKFASGIVVVLIVLGLALGYVFVWQMPKPLVKFAPTADSKLPEPRYDSNFSVEKAILERRSVREYSGEPLTLQEVSQLLWAAQGITDPRGFRTAPSAGALYPLEVYVVIGDVENFGKGVYKYKPHEHELIKVLDGDKREELAQAALGQEHIRNAAINIMFVAVFERTTVKYGERGFRYVYMEVGHAAQNVYLQATALNLATVTVGAFYDEQVKEVLNLPENEQPLCIMPVGKK